jgi:hypothetical protein
MSGLNHSHFKQLTDANGRPFPIEIADTDWSKISGDIMSGKKVPLLGNVKEASGEPMTWVELMTLIWSGFTGNGSVLLEFRELSCYCDLIISDPSPQTSDLISIWGQESWKYMYMVYNSSKEQVSPTQFYDYLLMSKERKPIIISGSETSVSTQELISCIDPNSGNPMRDIIRRARVKFPKDFRNVWMVANVTEQYAGDGICLGRLNMYKLMFDSMNISANEFMEIIELNTIKLVVSTMPTWKTNEQDFFDAVFVGFQKHVIEDTIAGTVQDFNAEFKDELNSRNFEQYKAGLLAAMIKELDGIRDHWNGRANAYMGIRDETLETRETFKKLQLTDLNQFEM